MDDVVVELSLAVARLNTLSPKPIPNPGLWCCVRRSGGAPPRSSCGAGPCTERIYTKCMFEQPRLSSTPQLAALAGAHVRSNPEANARVHGPHATPDEILTAGSTAARPPPEFNPLHQLLQVGGLLLQRMLAWQPAASAASGGRALAGDAGLHGNLLRWLLQEGGLWSAAHACDHEFTGRLPCAVRRR